MQERFRNRTSLFHLDHLLSQTSPPPPLMDINGLFSGGVECFVNPRVFIQFSSLRTMQSARTEQQTKNGSKGKKALFVPKPSFFFAEHCAADIICFYLFYRTL
ncbi:hypothetical protein NPIL_472351 [Nephila pilipes]|uniref:Uncharacterized protein n=1 Tax=Nephila pilipes TaxID=299642 RepID=A0A8X6Q104_NEPPI|nr:hypothetical protein NPIL_472351 [Nephila pilipes]